MFIQDKKKGSRGSRIDILHPIYRSIKDLRKFRHMGVKDIIATTVLPIEPSGARTYYDFFEWLCVREKARLKEINLRIHPCVGIPPMGGSRNPKLIDEALMYVEEFVRTEKAVGIGEIGMGTGRKEEYQAFKRQLLIAKKHDVPVIIQAPKQNKTAMTSMILKELKKSKISRAIIDHCDKEVLEIVARDPRRDIKVGITVGYGGDRVSPPEALQIYKNHTYINRIVFNTGLGIHETSMYGQSEIIELLEMDRVSNDIIDRVVLENYLDVFPELGSQKTLMY